MRESLHLLRRAWLPQPDSRPSSPKPWNPNLTWTCNFFKGGKENGARSWDLVLPANLRHRNDHNFGWASVWQRLRRLRERERPQTQTQQQTSAQWRRRFGYIFSAYVDTVHPRITSLPIKIISIFSLFGWYMCHQLFYFRQDYNILLRMIAYTYVGI